MVVLQMNTVVFRLALNGVVRVDGGAVLDSPSTLDS